MGTTSISDDSLMTPSGATADARCNHAMAFLDATGLPGMTVFDEPYWLCRAAVGAADVVLAIDLISTSDPSTQSFQTLVFPSPSFAYLTGISSNTINVGYNGTDLWLFYGHDSTGNGIDNIAFVRYNLDISDYASWNEIDIPASDTIIVPTPSIFDGMSGCYDRNDDSFYVYFNDGAIEGTDTFIKYKWNPIGSTITELGTEQTNLAGQGVDVNERIPPILNFGGITSDGSQVFCGSRVVASGNPVGGPEQYGNIGTWHGVDSAIIIESFYNTASGLVDSDTSDISFTTNIVVAGSDSQEITFNAKDTFNEDIGSGFITFQTEIGDGTDGTFSASAMGTFTNTVKIAVTSGSATAFFKAPPTLIGNLEATVVGAFSTT